MPFAGLIKIIELASVITSRIKKEYSFFKHKLFFVSKYRVLHRMDVLFFEFRGMFYK